MHPRLLFGILPLVAARSTGYGTDFIANVSEHADPAVACNILKTRFANLTFLPEDVGYKNETQGWHIHFSFYDSISSHPQFHGMLRLGSVPPVFLRLGTPTICPLL